MDGLIIIDKPRGRSSSQMLYEVRKLTGQRKSGHAGTLDPIATGVLILCLGRATKLVERLMDQPKVYRATARLDATSTSYDVGHLVRPAVVENVPTEEQVRAALASLEGEAEQIPPAVSALKIKGKPAYKMVGRDAAPVLPARTVMIYWLHLHGYCWPVLDYEMACGRGTYVRAVIRDIGVALGTGGCLTELRRTAVGPYRAADGWTPERIAAATPEQYLVPFDTAVEQLTGPSTPPPRPAG